MSDWQVATLEESHIVADDVMSLRFKVENWKTHEPGQHCDIRLTAPNGYQAQRSYSIANPPEDTGIVEFGVQLLPGGEVSPYLSNLKPGGQIEIKGPLGGHFIWNTAMPGPLVLIGGGSGMVPLMSMIRQHINHLETEKNRPVEFLISARDIGRILYKQELEEIAKKDRNTKIITTLTDKQPQGWASYARRIDQDMIRENFEKFLESMPMIYICGPTKFVEEAGNDLVAIGFNPHEIRTERFG